MDKRMEFLTRRIEECDKLINEGYKTNVDLVGIRQSAHDELTRIQAEKAQGTVMQSEHDKRINTRN